MEGKPIQRDLYNNVKRRGIFSPKSKQIKLLKLQQVDHTHQETSQHQLGTWLWSPVAMIEIHHSVAWMLDHQQSSQKEEPAIIHGEGPNEFAIRVKNKILKD